MSTERPLRAALLARVSTDMQAEEGLSIPAQLAEMREFCEKRGWKIVAEFIDAGYTGSTMERPGLQGLLAALEQRAFDVAVVHELSRLSRSIFDTFELFETFGRYNDGFASVK
jgi:site-specific DNA recombinase